MSIARDGINALPTELLCSIFRLAMEQYRDRAQRDRCRLMLVCRLWRDYIEGSASLWTYISADHGPTSVRRALERSKGAMVDLYCRLYKGPPWSAEAFMIDAGVHIARWRSLDAIVRLSSWKRELGPLSTTQPPCLEMLHLSPDPLNDRLPASETAVTLFGGAPAPPTLRTLKLHRIPVAFEPLGLSGLVSLALTKVPTISTPQLLEILRGCIELESLELQENRRLVAIRAQALNIQLIELPKLVSLSLQRMDHGGTNCILSNIRLPNHRRRVLFVDTIERTREVIASLFTPDVAHLLHPTKPTTDIPFSVMRVEVDDCIEMQIDFRGIRIAFRVSGLDAMQAILRWFVDGLGSEAAECPVHLIHNSASRLDPVRAVTVPTPLVVKYLWLPGDLLMPLKKALYTAMARAPDPMSSGWLLPQLESLSVWVGTRESGELLVSMLRSRYGGTTSASETESIRPVNLRSIELRHSPPRNEALVEEVRGILGHEVDVIITIK